MVSTIFFLLTVDPQYVTFECQRLQQSSELSFNLTWTLPSFLRYGNVISGFVVVPKLNLRVDNVIVPVQIDINVSVPLPQVILTSLLPVFPTIRIKSEFLVALPVYYKINVHVVLV